MTVITLEDQPLRGQKRRRDTTEEEYPINKPNDRGCKRLRQVQKETETENWWNSLSKIWLTRAALRELDRRTDRCKPNPLRSKGHTAQLGDLEQLKRFTRHGGADLCDLRGYSQSHTPNSTAYVMPSEPSTSRTQSKSRDTIGNSTARTTTSKTKKTSPYDLNFQQRLIDHGIYPDDYEFPDGRETPRPKNEDNIMNILGRSRASLSPSQFTETDFRSFKRKNSRALNEDAIMADVFPTIQGSASIPSAKNLAFGNLKPLVDGNCVDAKPDFYDGIDPSQIKRPIREELGSYIIPAKQGQAPAVANLFLEAKGPEGSAATAKRQACFNGVFGARGIYKLQSYGEDSTIVYDQNAYTITSTYHDGQLKIYTVHPMPSTDTGTSPEYHMTQLRSFAMTDAAKSFREGAGAFRNIRDWAKIQRDDIVEAANSKTNETLRDTTSFESPVASQSTIQPEILDSETSADELSQDIGQHFSFSHKRLKREEREQTALSSTRQSRRAKKDHSSRSCSRGRLLQKR